jgi:hypothetical protein
MYQHLTVWQKSINKLKFQDVLTVGILIENCETFTKNFHSFDGISMVSVTRSPCFCCSDAHSLSRQLLINTLYVFMAYHLCQQLILFVCSGKLSFLSWCRVVYIPYMVLVRCISGMLLEVRLLFLNFNTIQDLVME